MDSTNGSVITLNSTTPYFTCYPPGVAVDIAGNVYFDDTCLDGLYKWTAVGGNVMYLQPAGFAHPTGVAVDGSGNVYVADQADDMVWEWFAAKRGLTSPTGIISVAGFIVSGFNGPGGVTVDGSGNLYIADTANNAVKEWTQVFLDPSPKVEGPSAGNDSLPAMLPASATQLATFAPTSNEPWLTITGVTNGVVYFTFTATTATRTGSITIFGQSFPVTQRAPSVNLGLTALVAGPAAGSNSVVLAVYPHTYAWTATANASWLHLSPPNQSGTGSTNVIFSFDANPGATRSGILMIAGQTLTVTQAGSTYVPVESATTLVSGIPFADGDAVDGAGNVYFAANQIAIKKWTPVNNTVTTLFSSTVSSPTSVAVDSAGNAYFNSGGIQKWTAASNSLTLLTTASGPQLAVDVAGNVYFSSGNSIQVWTADNNVVSTLVPGLNGPGGVAVDVAGNVYISGGNGIQEWTPGNKGVITLVPPGSFSLGYLAVDGGGNLYIVVAQNSYTSPFAILKWTAASNTLIKLISSGRGAYYVQATVDSAGNVYFTDAYAGLLQELPNAFLDPTAKFEGLAGGNDSLPTVVPATVNLHPPLAPASDSPWLTISGVANGVVSYSFTTNLGLTRIGHVTLLGQSIPVTQIGPLFTLGTTNLYEGPAAGSDSVVLAVTPNIGVWTATNNVFWLHLSSNGTGGTNAVFSFDANPGKPRSGTLTIAGQTVTVTQAGSTYVQMGALTALASTGLSGPVGVAVDDAGNVYIADTGNSMIKKWTATNDTVTTLISFSLSHPEGVAVDGAGNVYIADTGNSAIKKWTAANNRVTTLASSGLANPAGVAVDTSGNVYIADTGNGAIKEWSPAGITVTTLVSSGLASPAGVALDVAGNVYVADTGNGAIKEWSPANHIVTSLISSGLSSPTGLTVDGAGNVFVSDTGNSAIKKWTPASNTVTMLPSSGLSSPTGVAVDGAGSVYVADTVDNAVQELPRAFVDPTYKLEGSAGGTDRLPEILPTTLNLLAPFAPTSDQSWLSIAGSTNGAVSFGITANTGLARTGHIQLLNQTISITQSSVKTPPALTSVQLLGNGGIRFSFTNDPSATFSVLFTTNLALPLAKWAVVGSALNISGDVFQFTSQPPAGSKQRYYVVRSP